MLTWTSGRHKAVFGTHSVETGESPCEVCEVCEESVVSGSCGDRGEPVDEELSPGDGEGTGGGRALCLWKLSMFRKESAET
jgi:hypothetical protein